MICKLLWYSFYLFKVIVYVNSILHLVSQIQGGTVVTCPPIVLLGRAQVALWCLWASPGMSPMPSLALVISCFDAVRWECRGGWGGGWVGWWVMVVGRAYLNSASLAPSSHCGLCTLILCAGTRDPLMNRYVARTKVITILLLMYPHVFV